jgi:hypothetical protein
MTAQQPMCDYPRVQQRALLVCLFCLILTIVRISGIHAHFSSDHEHDSGLHEIETSVGFVANDYDPNHLSAHDEHGDVDVDVVAKSAGKLPGLIVAVAFVSLFVLLFLPTSFASAQPAPPPARPPKWRRRSYLTPPSHAPPVTA